MAGTLLPAPFQYFVDGQGNPLVGGLIYTYITGTDTPAPVYHDAALATPWTNPIEIPASGVVTMYQDVDTLKMIVTDADGNIIPDYCVDPIQSLALTSGGASSGAVFSFGGAEDFPITATALPSGTTVATIHPGTSLFVVDSADLPPGDLGIQGMLQSGTAETVTASLVNMSQGFPDVPMVSISSTSTAGEIQTSTAITWPAGGTDRTFAIKTKTTTGVPSYGWTFTLVKI